MAGKRASPVPFIVFGVAIVGGSLWWHLDKAPSSPVTRLCTRVVDGDTLQLEGGERVRLIGVDTPESVAPNRPREYYGSEAAEFTRKLTEGKQIRLEYDHERYDTYGRTLAYVYLLEDSTFLNSEIIRQGYGYAYTRFPFRYQDEFTRLEREARENRRGLWARSSQSPEERGE